MLKFKNQKHRHDVDEQISNIFFESAPQKSAKKNHLIWLALPCFITICLIVVIAITIISSSNKHKDKDLSTKDSANRQSVFTGLIDFGTPISKYIKASDILDGIFFGKSEISGNLTLDNLRNADSSISGTSLDFTIDHNAGKNELTSDFSVKYRNANVLSLSSYMNNDKLIFKVPAKSEKLFSIDFEKLSARLKAYIENYTNSDSTGIGSDYIDSLISKDSLAKYSGDFVKLFGDTDIISLYLYKIQELYPKDYQKIVDGISLSPVEADEYGNLGVTYTVSEESLETLVKSVLTATIEDEELYRLMSPAMISLIGANSLRYATADGGEDISVTIDDILYDFQSAASAFAASYNDTLSFTVWRKNDGMLVGLKSDNTVTIGNYSISVEFNIETQNNDNPLDNAKITLVTGYHDNSFSITFDRTTSYNQPLSVKDHLTCSINGDNSIDVIYSEALDTTDNSYECHITVTTPDTDDISFMCSGNFLKLNAGKAFDFNIHELFINEGFNNLMTLNGRLAVDTEKCNIKKPSGNTTELTEMSADELNKLFGQLGELIK